MIGPAGTVLALPADLSQNPSRAHRIPHQAIGTVRLNTKGEEMVPQAHTVVLQQRVSAESYRTIWDSYGNL